MSLLFFVIVSGILILNPNLHLVISYPIEVSKVNVSTNEFVKKMIFLHSNLPIIIKNEIETNVSKLTMQFYENII